MTQDNFLNGAASQQTIGESIRMAKPDLLINANGRIGVGPQEHLDIIDKTFIIGAK